jgi:hypothetical protein
MPVGKLLPDGFAALITFDDFPDVELFVKEPTPPGYEGGGGNPQSTFHNVKFRTQRPKKLITVTGGSVRVAYDPAIVTRLLTTNGGLLLKNQFCHVQYADLSKHNWWGWVEAFRPDSLKEGVQPEATVQLEVSNLDNNGAEVGPTYTPPP